MEMDWPMAYAVCKHLPLLNDGSADAIKMLMGSLAVMAGRR